MNSIYHWSPSSRNSSCYRSVRWPGSQRDRRSSMKLTYFTCKKSFIINVSGNHWKTSQSRMVQVAQPMGMGEVTLRMALRRKVGLVSRWWPGVKGSCELLDMWHSHDVMNSVMEDLVGESGVVRVTSRLSRSIVFLSFKLRKTQFIYNWPTVYRDPKPRSLFRVQEPFRPVRWAGWRENWSWRLMYNMTSARIWGFRPPPCQPHLIRKP